MVKFSIIIPTFKRRELLERAIKSCVQSDRRNQVIVIDDDFSDDVFGQYLKQKFISQIDIVYAANSRRKGPNGAQLSGLTYIKNKYFICLNDDDFMVPGALQYISWIIERNSREHYQFNSLKSGGFVPCVRLGDYNFTDGTYEAWIKGKFEGNLFGVYSEGIVGAYCIDERGFGGEGVMIGNLFRLYPPLIVDMCVRYYDTSVEGISNNYKHKLPRLLYNYTGLLRMHSKSLMFLNFYKYFKTIVATVICIRFNEDREELERLRVIDLIVVKICRFTLAFLPTRILETILVNRISGK